MKKLVLLLNLAICLIATNSYAENIGVGDFPPNKANKIKVSDFDQWFDAASPITVESALFQLAASYPVIDTSFTAGSVIFSDGLSLAQDNPNFFWDDTNNRLGIGTTSPLDTLTVSGDVDIIHTSTEADDHALELDVDAAGFGDVKGIDIVYDTGTQAAGEDDAVAFIDVNRLDSTGGDVFGLEVLATEGSASVYGIKVGVDIGPVHQDSGSFANPTTGTDNTVSTDVAAMIDGSTGTTTAIFENDNEYILIGAASAFEELEIVLTTDASVSIKPTFGYSTAGSHQFTTFSPVDGTNGFRNTGVVAWDASDLTGHTTNDDTGTYDIKITRTRNNLATTPVLGYAKTAATTEYIWDKDGDLDIRSLIINDEGEDVDSRFEGDTEANLFYLDAGNNRIGIGLTNPATSLEVAGIITSQGLLPDGDATRDVGSTSAAFADYYVNGCYNLVSGGSVSGLLYLSGNDVVLENTVNGGDFDIRMTNGDFNLGSNPLVSTGTITTTDKVEAENFHIQSDETYATILEADNTELGADRTLTFELSNADRTLKVYGDAEVRDWFNQNVKSTGEPTFVSLTLDLATGNDYKFGDRAGGLYLCGITAANSSVYEQYTNDGDGTDSITQNMFAEGTPTSLTNFSLFQRGYIAGDGYYRLRSVKANSGTARGIRMWSEGNTDQLRLDTGGEVFLAGVYDDDIGTERDLLIQSDGQLGYDSSSAEFKENIVDLPDNISEKIYQLQARKYDKIGGKKGQIGLIAEEVATLFPQFVSYKREPIMGMVKDLDPVTNKVIEVEGITGYRLAKDENENLIPETVNYKYLVTPLLKEVYRLKTRIEELEARIP